jgi:hypothetical protein
MKDIPLGGISECRFLAARHEPGMPHGYIRVRFVDYEGMATMPSSQEARARPLAQAGVLHKPQVLHRIRTKSLHDEISLRPIGIRTA